MGMCIPVTLFAYVARDIMYDGTSGFTVGKRVPGVWDSIHVPHIKSDQNGNLTDAL